MTVEGDVKVEQVNGLHLPSLYARLLSKTRDQKVFAHYDFLDDVEIGKGRGGLRELGDVTCNDMREDDQGGWSWKDECASTLLG